MEPAGDMIRSINMAPYRRVRDLKCRSALISQHLRLLLSSYICLVSLRLTFVLGCATFLEELFFKLHTFHDANSKRHLSNERNIDEYRFHGENWFLGTWFAILFVKFHVNCHGSKVATINQMLR